MHNVNAALLQITVVSYYKLRQIYYKLRQSVILNYGSFITNYDNVLLDGSFVKLLQITAAFGVITSYGNILLQITACVTQYGVITHYVVTGKTYFM